MQCISSNTDGTRCINNHSYKTCYCVNHMMMSKRSYMKYKKATRRMDYFFNFLRIVNIGKLYKMCKADVVFYIRLCLKMLHILEDCYIKRRIHIERYVHPSCLDHGHLAQFYFIEKRYTMCMNLLLKLYSRIGSHDTFHEGLSVAKTKYP